MNNAFFIRRYYASFDIKRKKWRKKCSAFKDRSKSVKKQKTTIIKYFRGNEMYSRKYCIIFKKKTPSFKLSKKFNVHP